MLRECELSDRDTWCELNLEFMSYEYEDENVWEDPLEKGDPGKVFDAIVGDEDSTDHLFLIEEEGEAVGFINTGTFTSVWAHGKVLLIDDLYIAEEFRGKGYGKKALKDLGEIVRSHGYQSAHLLAEDTNPKATPFYENVGFDKQRINFFCKYI